MHSKLKDRHKLKHDGRNQYGLFLKGIGVSLEDALNFWKSEFCQVMSLKVFEQSYAYNIRHNYGKEGNKVNYSPYGCVKLILNEHFSMLFLFDSDFFLQTFLLLAFLNLF